MTDQDVTSLRFALWVLYVLIAAALTRYVFFGPGNAENRRLAKAMERIATALERIPGTH